MRGFNALTERFRNSCDWLDYRAALICAVLANTVRDPKKKVKPFAPGDFMPASESKQQTAEQMFANVRLLNTAFGGNVLEV